MKKHKNLVFSHFKNSSDINHEIFLARDLILVIQSNLFWLTPPSPPTLKLPSKCWISCSVSPFPALTIHRPEGKYFCSGKVSAIMWWTKQEIFQLQASERVENFQLFHRNYFKMHICLESDRLWNSCSNLLLGARAGKRRQKNEFSFFRPRCIIRLDEQSSGGWQLTMHQTHTAGKIASLNHRGRK